MSFIRNAFRIAKEWFFIEILRKDFLTIYILNKVKDVYQIENSEILFNTMITKYSYDKRNYAINLSKAILGFRNQPILYYEKKNPTPLMINEANNEFDSDLLYTMLEDKNAEDFLATPNKDMIFIIIGLIILIIAVSVFAVWIINNLNNQIAELLKKIQTTGVIIR